MTELTEIWKPIKGFRDYEVSNLGRVKSLKRGKERLLSLSDKGGYKSVCFSMNNVSKNFYVHRLVAESFLNNPKRLPEVNHIDEDKSNNRIDNLEWCSRTYNNNHGKRKEKSSISQKGKPSCRAVEAFIGNEVHYSFSSITEAYRHGFKSMALIRACCHDSTKKYKGYFWRLSNY